MYAGSNSIGGKYVIGSPQKNPNYLMLPEWKAPRKTPSDLKAWTFDKPENKDVNRKTWLVEQLLQALKNSKEKAWFPQVQAELNPEINEQITKEELELAVDLDQKGRYITKISNDFGYDDSQTKAQVNTDEIYANFKWSVRGVEQ